jgi:hypothetical protein
VRCEDVAQEEVVVRWQLVLQLMQDIDFLLLQVAILWILLNQLADYILVGFVRNEWLVWTSCIMLRVHRRIGKYK